MRGSREWADRIIEDLNRIQTAATAARPASASHLPGEAKLQAAAPAKLDPRAVAEALAEALTTDDSVTQAISVRVSNWAQKYPERAF